MVEDIRNLVNRLLQHGWRLSSFIHGSAGGSLGHDCVDGCVVLEMGRDMGREPENDARDELRISSKIADAWNRGLLTVAKETIGSLKLTWSCRVVSGRASGKIDERNRSAIKVGCL